MSCKDSHISIKGQLSQNGDLFIGCFFCRGIFLGYNPEFHKLNCPIYNIPWRSLKKKTKVNQEPENLEDITGKTKPEVKYHTKREIPSGKLT